MQTGVTPGSPPAGIRWLKLQVEGALAGPLLDGEEEDETEANEDTVGSTDS